MSGLNSGIIKKQQEALKIRDELGEKLYMELQKDPNKWFTSKELGEKLGLTRARVKSIMANNVKPKHPDIVSSKHTGYKVSKRIEAHMPSKRKNLDMRNSEGYFDPTAGAAIRNAEADNPYKTAGEVWRTEAANGDVEYFLVFAEYSTTRLGIPFYIQPGARFVDPVIIDSLGGAKLYGDCTQVKSKPKKYMIDPIGTIDTNQLNDIRRRTCEAICLPVQSKPEKVVEPIVINNKVYKKNDILDLLAHENSLTQLYEQLKNSYSTLKAENKKLDDRIGVLSQEKTQLIVDNKKLGDKIKKLMDREDEQTDKTVEQMIFKGKTYTRDDILSLLSAYTVYKEFFTAYTSVLKWENK